MAFSTEEKNKIIQELQQKGVSSVCPRCSRSEWILGETYTTLSLQEMKKGLVIGGPSIPSIMLICKNCGNIEMHASKILAGLPEEGKND